MIAQVLVVIVTHLALPLFFTAWVARAKPDNRLESLAVMGVAASYLVFMQAAGAAWDWVSGLWRYGFWLLLSGAVLYQLRSWKGRPWRPGRAARPSINIAICLLVTAFFSAPLLAVFTARDFEGDAVDMAAPVAGGTYQIVHGGADVAVNHHYPNDAQRYALDIVRLNFFRVRAEGLRPRELERYYIWGTEVLAPCDGEIVAHESALPDMEPPGMDSDNPAGNYVAVHCNGVTVVLAHLRAGSVSARTGDYVRTGKVLGRVGNSGNTSEPHLHIHAVRGRQTSYEGLIGTGEGVPITFDGRFLVRNDRVRF